MTPSEEAPVQGNALTPQINRGKEMSMDGHVIAPGREAIARLAYQIWEERGRPTGSAEGDWYEAERQLQTRTRGMVSMPSPPTSRVRGSRRTRTGARMTGRRPT